ncbi:SURF1 family protein [Allopusillimonas ginsengisoli]|uniref:SURF1 family protein n=1 Tax=Allopusillimonas ginsengisoli TaxID=453575 RepID=UPI00101FAD87|nr:SURF1 family protein [Allopusillimonas ginsengisoli]TEA78969.1 SURF1 family protein [Allopusillimonas ginsengisoli]
MPHSLPEASSTPPTTRFHPRRGGVLLIWAVLAAVAFSGFIALGNWQLRRLAWKHELIARVTQRTHAPAVPVPDQAHWPAVSVAQDEYRKVTLHGTFLHQDETLVQASTELGAGFWVLTPLKQVDGSYVLVNRGFVSPAHRDPASRGQPAPQGEVNITGLLRLPEPGGAFLRHNKPSEGRWYSRDVQAIAALHGLAPTAPFFVDQSAPPGTLAPGPTSAMPTVWPVPGLTVVSFRDNHLVYAITWYVLALMVAGAAVFVGRLEYLQRRCPGVNHEHKNR